MNERHDQQQVRDRLIAPPPNKKFRAVLLLEVPAIIVAVVMMLHISLNAILRTFFSRPINATLEITEYWYMPLLAFLGFMAAQMRGEHVTADFIFNMIPAVTRKYVQGIAFLAIAVVCIGFAFYSGGEALKAFEVLRTAGVSSVPAWPVYFLSPFAFGVLTIQFLMVAIKSFRGKTPSQDPELDYAEVESIGAA